MSMDVDVWLFGTIEPPTDDFVFRDVGGALHASHRGGFDLEALKRGLVDAVSVDAAVVVMIDGGVVLASAVDDLVLEPIAIAPRPERVVL